MTLPEQIQAWADDQALTHQQSPAGTAVFGPGFIHRYALTRTWEPTGTHAVFVLLNPSEATALQDDPTLRRLAGFARREGHGGLVLANAFAVRSKSPSVLDTRSPAAHAATVGAHNDELLQLLARETGDVVVGWGTWGRKFQRAAAVEQLLTASGARLWALGLTRDGHPRHPLYLAKDTPLTPYEPGGVAR
ncbi:DUF1643 domain-containing protein [Streptomyces sp. NPDC005227]|uniref:DUF1643 domain-containing protein n=1 Tax=Streptomyces sp. NPDC005227 TaxID=3364707 RepID=UPI00369C64F9